MTKRKQTNVAASVHARLLDRSRQTGEDFNLLLQRYAAERFLYRLGCSDYRNHFVLKGAMLFPLWGGPIYRATRDLDFTGYGDASEEALRQCFAAICTQPVRDDGIVFDVSTIRIEPILDEAEYNGLRVRFEGRLGSARIPMQVDVGFGNAIEPPATDETYPTLLDGPAPRIRAYPVEAVVAEKLPAIHRFGATNSRLKDFYDLYVLSEQFDFDGNRLGQAIAATFERRATPIDTVLPVGLQTHFFADDGRAGQWQAYLSRNGLPGAPSDFQAVGERLRAFFGPIWDALAAGSTCDGRWQAGNGWSFGPAPASPDLNTPPATEATFRRFQPYPAYKDSGVQWLGEIPAHWEVKPLKFAVAMNPDVLDEGTNPDYEILYIDVGNVDSTGAIQGTESLRFENAPTRARRKVRAGDTILSTVRTYLKAIAFMTDPPDNLIVSTGFAVLRPGQNAEPKFVWRLVQSQHFVDAVVSHSEGVGYPAINPSRLGRLVVWLPPLSEQRAIAAFLDRETAKIDALVAKKERLIELLQEKRTALITRAVTKGLDPTVPMKDSGVEWLGEIPAHWELRRLKTIADVQLSNVDKKSVEGQESVRLCNYTDVYYNERLTAELNFMAATATREQVGRFGLREGDVLITKDSESWTDIAVPAVVAEDLPGVLCGYHLAHIRPKRECYGPFLARAFSAIGPRDQFQVAANGITRFGLSHDAIATGVFAMPPESEQRAIAAFLDRETAKIDALIAKVREAIERLKEYRTALISAAVTGKIDVTATLEELRT